ncbi:MAG: S4 domain-containing protein [Schleiferiaceae bacterium]|jgi:ribosome-associated heat shock protein Hsp15|nr:S4 domain-containing protein [Schleiferiaceae bacterium]
MRIDKYLWCVRLFKTRSLAADQVKTKKVMLDGEFVKASREVKEGQKITVKHHGYDQEYEILGWPKSRVGAKLVELYLKEITSPENIERKEFLQLAKNYTRRKGLGRPTKKERREWDDLDL